VGVPLSDVAGVPPPAGGNEGAGGLDVGFPGAVGSLEVVRRRWDASQTRGEQVCRRVTWRLALASGCPGGSTGPSFGLSTPHVCRAHYPCPPCLLSASVVPASALALLSSSAVRVGHGHVGAPTVCPRFSSGDPAMAQARPSGRCLDVPWAC
jgi:hypothetical protein